MERDREREALEEQFCSVL